MSNGHWTSGDLSRAAAIPDKAAMGWVQDRIGTAKDPFDTAIFELLLDLGKARVAPASS